MLLKGEHPGLSRWAHCDHQGPEMWKREAEETRKKAA